MAVEQKVKVIVMLTKLREKSNKDGSIGNNNRRRFVNSRPTNQFMNALFSVDKCHKYWPEVGSTLTFGPITVENMKEEGIEALDGLRMRKLKVAMRFTMDALTLSESHSQFCSNLIF